MKVRHLILALFLSSSITSFAQYDPDYNNNDDEDLNSLSFKDRLYTGGNFWGSFGQISVLEISPIVGYRITNDYSAGVGLKYSFYKQNVAPVFSTSIYGGSVFTRYVFLDRLVAHAELEMLNVEVFRTISTSERLWVPIGLVGGGYSANGFQAMLLYDVIGNENNPYIGTFGPNSRIYLRVGFLFNL